MPSDVTWSSIYGYTNDDMDSNPAPWFVDPDGADFCEALISFGGDLYAFIRMDNTDTSSVWKSTDNGANWTEISDTPPWAGDGTDYGYHAYTVLIFDDPNNGDAETMWKIGGQVITPNFPKDDVWKSVDGVNWTKVRDSGDASGFDPRYFHASCVFDSKMWVTGGYTLGDVKSDDVYSSTDGITWALEAGTPGFAARAIHICAVVGEKMMVAGGFGSVEGLSDVWTSPDGVTWTQVLAEGPWGQMYLTAYYAENGNVWSFGGYDDVTGDLIVGGYHTVDGIIWTPIGDNATEWWNKLPPLSRTSMTLHEGNFILIPGKGFDNWLDYEASEAETWRLPWVFATTDGDIIPDEIPDETFWYEDQCIPTGQKENQDTSVANDFTRGMMFDLTNGTVWPMKGFNFSCVFGQASPCAGSVGLYNRVFAGGTDGYIYEAFLEDASGLGTPTNKVEMACTDASTVDLVVIDPEEEETFWPAGLLPGLAFLVKYADGTTATGTVSTNTNSTFVPVSSLSVAPASGDTVMVAPMLCGALFEERRFLDYASLKAMRLNVHNTQDQAQDFTLNVHKADALEPHATVASTGDPTINFDTDDLDLREGHVFMGSHASRALAYDLQWLPAGNGRLYVTPQYVQEIVQSNEPKQAGDE